MLTAERLREVLTYEPTTGEFIRRDHIRKQGKLARMYRGGQRAGAKHRMGYIIIWVDHQPYFAHRLAWLYVMGKWPAEQIDHRNRVRDDNRWNNLREATAEQNRGNMKLRSRTNRNGFRGIYFHKRRQRYEAKLGKQRLGYFLTADEAHAAYVQAHVARFGEFSNLAKRAV